MGLSHFLQTKSNLFRLLFLLLLLSSFHGFGFEGESSIHLIHQIQSNRDNQEMLKRLLPIVACSFTPSKYEQVLMTELRNKESSMKEFRNTSKKIGEILVSKVIDCLPTASVDMETPVSKFEGEVLKTGVDLVSIMRSGDALLETFMEHFPRANINKILVQRDEKTAKPNFKYMKVAATVGSGHFVVVTEPMVATGGTLEMVITLLKEKGVQEEKIIIACICASPEGLVYLNERFPSIKVVLTVLDEKLNEKKYIVPGLGDFGDRYFGTIH